MSSFAISSRLDNIAEDILRFLLVGYSTLSILLMLHSALQSCLLLFLSFGGALCAINGRKTSFSDFILFFVKSMAVEVELPIISGNGAGNR